MLDFLKKLFKSEGKEKVDFFELTKWLFPKLDMGIEDDFEKIRELDETLSLSLKNLEAVDVKSMKVEEKLKGFVLGNRKAYILSLNTFRRSLEKPERLDSKSILNYCNELQKGMTSFSKKTTKNFFIMQNLIGKELEEIRKNLNELTKLIKEMPKKAEKLKLIEDILSKLKEIYNYIDEKDNRKKALSDLEKQRDELLDKEKKLKDKIEKFKQGEVFSELNKLKQKRDSLENGLYIIKSHFNNDFASISRPLRKLAKMYMDKLLEKYLDNPFETLFKDETLEIINLLESLKKEINSNKITEKNQDKILITLEKMNKNYFENMKNTFREQKKELEICNSKIENNSFDKDLQEFLDSLKKIETRLAETDEKIENFKERVITKDIEKIEQDIKKLGFNIEVENAPFNQ